MFHSLSQSLSLRIIWNFTQNNNNNNNNACDVFKIDINESKSDSEQHDLLTWSITYQAIPYGVYTGLALQIQVYYQLSKFPP